MTPEPDSALAKAAHETLEQARQMIASHEIDRLPEAAALAERACAIFTTLHSQGHHGARHGLAAAAITRAKALREIGTETSRVQALDLYPAALGHLQAVLDPEQPDQVNELAGAWVQRGITLMDAGSRTELVEALGCFDQAIELRKGLPLVQRPFFRWGLAAAWMNRADVLTRLGGEPLLQDALNGYDEAIRQLVLMPADEHPSHLSRLSLAWMNRGLTCQALPTPIGPARALSSFNEAVALLRTDSTLTNPEQRRLLACCLLNRGGALLAITPAQPLPARKDAIVAIRLAAEFERTELLAAQMGLQARHLLCRAVACIADTGFRGLPESEDWVTQTTDAVDEGMALSRHWCLLGEDQLQALALDLFRFGSLVYAVCQPHFLPEFLLDSLDPARSPGAPGPSKEMYGIAVDALWNATTRARQQPGREQLLEELREGERQLVELGELLRTLQPGARLGF